MTSVAVYFKTGKRVGRFKEWITLCDNCKDRTACVDAFGHPLGRDWCRECWNESGEATSLYLREVFA